MRKLELQIPCVKAARHRAPFSVSGHLGNNFNSQPSAEEKRASLKGGGCHSDASEEASLQGSVQKIDGEGGRNKPNIR